MIEDYLEYLEYGILNIWNEDKSSKNDVIVQLHSSLVPTLILPILTVHYEIKSVRCVCATVKIKMLKFLGPQVDVVISLGSWKLLPYHWFLLKCIIFPFHPWSGLCKAVTVTKFAALFIPSSGLWEELLPCRGQVQAILLDFCTELLLTTKSSDAHARVGCQFLVIAITLQSSQSFIFHFMVFV